MSLGWREPTNLENRHRTEKPRVILSRCSDWSGKEKGKKDSGLHLLLPGPQGKVTGVSPALSSARTTVMYLVLLLTDGSGRMDSRKFGTQRDFMASDRRVRREARPGDIALLLRRNFELLVSPLC